MYYATGYNNITLYIWNLLDKSKIIKHPPKEQTKNPIIFIYQVDDNTIAYGITYYNSIFIWNFKDDTKKSILCDSWTYVDSVVILRKNLMAHIQYPGSLNILNVIKDINVNHAIYRNHYTNKCVSLLDNNVIIGLYENNKVTISIIEKNDFILLHNKNEKNVYEFEHSNETFRSLKIIPCHNKFSPESVPSNNIIIIETFVNDHNMISILHIGTQQITKIINNIVRHITSVIYLNSGYFAMLTSDDIIIYHIISKTCVQTIKNEYNKFILLDAYNNGFITVNDSLNIQMYE